MYGLLLVNATAYHHRPAIVLGTVLVQFVIESSHSPSSSLFPFYI